MTSTVQTRRTTTTAKRIASRKELSKLRHKVIDSESKERDKYVQTFKIICEEYLGGIEWEEKIIDNTKNTVILGMRNEGDAKRALRSVSYDLGKIGPFSQQDYMLYASVKKDVEYLLKTEIDPETEEKKYPFTNVVLEEFSGLHEVPPKKGGDGAEPTMQYGHYFMIKCAI